MDEISSWALDTVGIDTFKSCVLACSFQYFYKKSELASIMLNKKIMLHVRKKKKKNILQIQNLLVLKINFRINKWL